MGRFPTGRLARFDSVARRFALTGGQTRMAGGGAPPPSLRLRT